jgi:hypothetical protein
MLLNKIQIPKVIFVISLKNYFKYSKDRTENLVLSLKNMNFDITNINFVGVNGEHLLNKKINNKYISYKKYRFDMNLGTMGCALSQALVLKLIQIKNLTTDILVLEEDAVPSQNFCNIFKYIPVDYDIIYLHSYHVHNFYYQSSLKGGHSNGFNIMRKIIKPTNYKVPTGLNALLINGRHINKIIKTLLPFKEAADWHYLNHYQELNQYYVNPDLGICNNPCASISTREILDERYKHKNKIPA